MVCLVVGLVLLWGVDQPLLAAVVALPGAVGVSVGRLLDSMAGTRATREHAASYTTLVEGTGPADVEHVDPRTGRLVSFAGEDLSRDERRARVAAVRADARLGVLQPEPVSAATADDSTEDVDEELFAGRPRTFITLPWTIRQGAAWGVLLVALAPLGFVVHAMLDAGGSVSDDVAAILVGLVLVTAALAAVGLIVTMRRADTMLGESGPGGSRRFRDVVLSLWVVPLAIAVLLGAGFTYGTYQTDRLDVLRFDGVRVTAHDAKASKTSSGRGARTARVAVDAVVDYADGPRSVQLDHDTDPSLPDDLPRGTWTDAPAPYAGTFTVVHHPEDPDLVVAEADLVDAEAFIPVAGLDRAALMSAGWAIPWFVAWLVMVRRAATAGLRP